MKKEIIILILIMLPIIHASKVIEICYNKTVSDMENECYTNLTINTDKDYYNNKDKITFYNNLSLKNSTFIIEYWIENNTNNIIKDKTNTTNLNAKSYTPNLKLPGNIKIKNKLISIDCNNTNNITYSEKEVFIYVYQDTNPYFDYKTTLNKGRIESLNDTIKTKVNIYTGNLSNQTLKVSIANISTEEVILNEYQTSNLTIYSQIPYDCSTITGNYTLKISLFNKEFNEPIFIENTCSTDQSSNDNINITSNDYLLNSESNINLSENSITGNIIYESAGEKAKKYSLYFIIAIIIFTVIYVLPNKLITKTTG